MAIATDALQRVFNTLESMLTDNKEKWLNDLFRKFGI
jgi:hypothetical protein